MDEYNISHKEEFKDQIINYQSAIITRKSDNSIIAQGRIIFIKNTGKYELHNDTLISFDNKYFFHKAGNKHYNVNIVDDELSYKLYDLTNLIIKSWNTGEITYDIDIFVEHPGTELDSEIKDLVFNINKFEGIKTTGSCSGHGYMYGFLSMIIENFSGIHLLCYLLNDKTFKLYNYWDWELGPKLCYSDILHDRTEFDKRDHFPVALRCKHKGFEDINKLNEALEICMDLNLFPLKNDNSSN